MDQNSKKQIKIHKTDQNLKEWIKFQKMDQIPKKSNLWWNNPKPGLFPVGQDFSGLPPLFVRGVGHVQDVAIGEAQTPRG